MKLLESTIGKRMKITDIILDDKTKNRLQT